MMQHLDTSSALYILLNLHLRIAAAEWLQILTVRLKILSQDTVSAQSQLQLLALKTS